MAHELYLNKSNYIFKKKNPKCVNIKQGILEETFHKSKSILGRHQAFQTMKLNKTKLRT